MFSQVSWGATTCRASGGQSAHKIVLTISGTTIVFHCERCGLFEMPTTTLGAE